MARLDDGTPVMIPHGGEAPEDDDRIAELLRFADREHVGSCSVCGTDIYSEDALRDRDGMCASRKTGNAAGTASDTPIA